MVRAPLFLFAYVVELLRHLPGADRVGRRTTWLVRALFIGSAGLLLIWASTPTPQRISLSNLADGNLSPMQSWIIVSGDLREERNSVPERRAYRLTDAAVRGPSLVVLSAVPLPVGPATISGDLVGGRDIAYVQQAWVGTLRADPTLAHEIPPPWGAAAVALAGLLVVAARRTTYPMFFAVAPRASMARDMTIKVTVRRSGASAGGRVSPGTIVLGSGEGTAVLATDDEPAPVPLRLHSEFTGATVGDLVALSWRQPAVRLRHAAEDMTLAFATSGERDAVFAALQEKARTILASSTDRRRAGAPPAPVAGGPGQSCRSYHCGVTPDSVCASPRSVSVVSSGGTPCRES